MKLRSVLITGVACSATLFATGLGATGFLGSVAIPRATVSDRKAPVMVCNGGLAYTSAVSIIRGVGAGWRRH
ncbi:MAG TPA: hypothetical protein VN513_11230 [Gemmatimonadales bacterium]|nr:hypothetical protein [Gemmatimonadales bacterium]